jgi:hypothetical protein
VLPERRRVIAVLAGCLTLDRGLARSHAAGTTARLTVVDLTARAFQTNAVIGGQVQEVIVTTKAGLRN